MEIVMHNAQALALRFAKLNLNSQPTVTGVSVMKEFSTMSCQGASAQLDLLRRASEFRDERVVSFRVHSCQLVLRSCHGPRMGGRRRPGLRRL